MRRSARLPEEFERFSPRQREILRVIYTRGGATAREIHRLIPDPPPSVAGIRTLLNRMVRRGHVKTRPSGRHSEVIYLMARCTEDVQLKAFRRVAEEFFDGSKRRAFHTLLRMAGAEAAQTYRRGRARAA